MMYQMCHKLLNILNFILMDSFRPCKFNPNINVEEET